MRLPLSLVAFVLMFVPLSDQPAIPDSPASAPRQDAWKILGPGGGGAQFSPTISPHDPKRVLISCDMTGAYISQDGGTSWRMFNLRGTVRFFVFDPNDAKTIYASTIGLWRSTDEGRTWRLVFPEPGAVTRIEMPDDHAGARFATADGQYRTITALAIDPADSQILYAAIADERESHLNISNDMGKTWKSEAELVEVARKIYVDPHSPSANRTLYIVGANSVTVRENGRWERRPAPAGVTSFTDVSGGFPRSGGKLVLYVITAAGKDGAAGIHISSDGGATWMQTAIISSSQAPEPRLSAVATCLNQPDVTYVSYSNLYLGSGGGEPFFGVAKTSNGGHSWSLVWKESRASAPNLHDIWITERFGPGWGENPLRLGVGPNDPNLCYGTDYGRTMRTADGGENWYGAYSRKMPGGAYTTTGLDVTTCYGVHFDPFNKKSIFISYTDIGLFRSDDGGVSWMSATKGVPQEWVNTTYWIEFDPQVKGRVWGVMSGTHDLPRPKMWRRQSPERYKGGVCLSEDGGRTWRSSSGNLPPTAATHILLDPTSPATARVLYVTGFGRGVFKSIDGGRTWALKNQGIEGKEPLAWRLARDRNGVLYLVVARRSEDGSYGNDMDGALYCSTDGAEHWERIELPQGVNGPNGIAVDPESSARLYLACWGRRAGREAVQGGVFLSTDSGKSWRNTLARDQHVYDITIDPKDSKILYACGFESSAWRSADRGESWTRIRGFDFKWGHRVVPDPFNPRMIYITTFGGSVWYGPAEGDSRAIEDIVTPEVAYTTGIQKPQRQSP